MTADNFTPNSSNNYRIKKEIKELLNKEKKFQINLGIWNNLGEVRCIVCRQTKLKKELTLRKIFETVKDVRLKSGKN